MSYELEDQRIAEDMKHLLYEIRVLLERVTVAVEAIERDR